MSKSITQALVLAAGKGTRMGTVTEHTPKPMLPIHGKPMLEHILERLAIAKVERFLIVVGYRHELVEEHFRGWRLPVTFAVQENVNGTGSATLIGRGFAANEPFFLTYGDILCEPSEYVNCGTTLLSDPAIAAVLAVKEVDDPWQGAAVYEEKGRIRQVIEKPPKGTSTTRWNSAGIYAFRPIVFDYLQRIQPSPRGEYELTSAFGLMLGDGLDLRITPVTGEWRDVGRPEDLAAENADTSILER